ncbi:DUF262 domain-containing protein [Chitinophaga nivalis]|uniref:DUF262 domain-containing protein n=1 Tax=Chitinophaga nivalis TaxID=2991709 RepID=A0ABT3IFH2_9BACT|nr:DUF262 domain-containing protein [Chitinophaga nivalis]MCW3467612.1 DUF262 domain-containing protein [Chitinophaga nivalis]MCW3482696.1 DUF262 domain-containing protein [Chitinophaga nivalis]
MPENKLTLKTIQDLAPGPAEQAEKFFIPSYQRGYRWTAQQVTDLLDDLLEFDNREEKKQTDIYCLQPVVVKKKEDKWEVIDGQQRLTTIYIIISYITNSIFNKKAASRFTLTFETRPNSEQFLIEIDESKKEKNIDYYHICEAHRAVRTWFEKKGDEGLMASTLYPVLLKKVNIIWYQINDDTDPIDIFTRINMGKIALTNAELIRALFLQSSNFPDHPEEIRLKQLEIAGEWDRIEYALQDDAFWYFLCNGEKKYATRIEFIFDLMAEKPLKPDDFYTFRKFQQDLQQDKIDAVWLRIKKYYMTLEEWYQNRTLYHQIGYLVATGTSIATIKAAAAKLTSRADFTAYLENSIAQTIQAPITKLTYGEHNNTIRKVLLLFNIETLLANTASHVYFPFHRFKTEEWDIEHIHAVQSEMPESREHQCNWLQDVLDHLQMEDPSLQTAITDFLNTPPKQLPPDAFAQLYNRVVDKYTEEGDDVDVNDISNLALLNTPINRGYKNAVFPVKRKTIITKDKAGVFIPICTKNVFLKYYSQEVSLHMTHFSRKDREDYLAAIVATLKKYIVSPLQNN